MEREGPQGLWWIVEHDHLDSLMQEYFRMLQTWNKVDFRNIF